EADPARPRQPARHALDGTQRARRRHPRDPRRRVDRLLALAWVHPDAHSRRGVAVRARPDRDPRLHRPGVVALRPKHVAQALAIAAVAGLLALLIWKVAHPTHVAKGRAPNFTLPRLDRDG